MPTTFDELELSLKITKEQQEKLDEVFKELKTTLGLLDEKFIDLEEKDFYLE